MTESARKVEDILVTADPACGELRDVPIGTVIGLAHRGLIEGGWKSDQQPAGTVVRCVHRVRLSGEGMRVARLLQKLRGIGPA